MTSITPFGGIQEIGGNKFLVKEGGTSVILDFGLSYKVRRKFFGDPFLRPRNVDVMLELGLLPEIDRAYSIKGERPFEAVILSHAHKDHAGHVGLIREDIPIWAGEASVLILRAIRDTSRRDPEFYIGEREIQKFHTGDILRIDSIEISPIHVDHSIPGAYGFVIRTPSSIIGYTGDFRLHGPRADMTLDLIEAMKRDRPDLLLIEHTNIMDGEASSEAEVEAKISRVSANAHSLVIGDFALADLDRYRSFYRAAERAGRRLVISARRALILDALSTDHSLSVPGAKEGVRVLEREDVKIHPWEDEICDKWGTVKMSEISSNQRNYMLIIPPSELQGVIKVGLDPGSIFIFSSSEPFNEEMELEYDRLLNWLEALGMPIYRIHASGHASPNDLRRFVNEIRPKVIVPIHGEYPHVFSKFIEDLCPCIQIPSHGEQIVL